MDHPTDPDTARLDLRRETGSLVYLAERPYDDMETPEETRVLCEAIFGIHESAERALDQAVRWSEARSNDEAQKAAR